jgi:hypothetical protein
MIEIDRFDGQTLEDRALTPNGAHTSPSTPNGTHDTGLILEFGSFLR